MAQSIPKTAASFENSLNAQVVAGDTTFELTSATDVDGVALAAGLYGFTVDGDTNAKEFVIGVLSGTSVSSVFSISAQNVATSGFSEYHRPGASVAITDWVALGRIGAVTRGEAGFDSAAPLFYDAAPAGLSGSDIPDVNYVLSVVNGGTVSFNNQIFSSQIAGENLTANDHVYFKESDQRWYKVDADLTATYQMLKRGYAAATQTTGGTLQIYNTGLVGGFSGLTPGSKYYASNTAGAISTTPGTNTVYAGTAFSATQLIVDFTVRDIPYGSEKDALAGSLGTPSSTNKYVTQDNTTTGTTDQSQLTANGTSAVGAASTTGLRNRLAQSFIPTKSKIRGVNLYKQADTGTFTGTVSVALQADSSGSPSNVDLAAVTINNATWLAYPVGVFQALFASQYSSMTAGSTYWIVITTSTADTSNRPNIGINTAGGYANGSSKFFNATDGWTAIADIDLYFATLEGTASQVVLTDSTGVIPSTVLTPANVGLTYGVGALSSTFAKTFYNVQLLFTLWTGSTSGAATTDFTNWSRASTDVIIPPLGLYAYFDNTDSESLSLSNPFRDNAGVALTFAASNTLVFDVNFALKTADESVWFGLIEDASTGPTQVYTSTTYRRVGFAYNGTTLYGITCNGTTTTALALDVSNITVANFNNYQFVADFGADTLSLYVNGIYKGQVTTTFPSTGNVHVAFGRQDDAQFVVTAPNIAIELVP